MKDLTVQQMVEVSHIMSNSLEFYSPKEVFETFTNEFKLTKEQADWVLSFEKDFLTDPFFELPGFDSMKMVLG